VCHLQIGREKKVAIVLACPGQDEELIGMPAAGPTGQNLKILLDLLSHQLKRQDLIRQNITVTNSSVRVIYGAKDKVTEPTETEVGDAKNICRIYEELREVSDFVIFSGQRAKILMNKLVLPNNPKFIHIRHLGFQSLNQIKLEDSGNKNENNHTLIEKTNTQRRLEIVVNDIVEQLTKKPWAPV
jgi:hypothetical protein